MSDQDFSLSESLSLSKDEGKRRVSPTPRTESPEEKLDEIGEEEPNKTTKDTNEPSVKSSAALGELPSEIADLFATGAHFGHHKSRVHPSMFPFIFGVRSAVHIIDVQQAVEKLAEAASFLNKMAAAGKLVLFVGTKFPVRKIVRDAAQACGMPYMIERWAGGTLTNWKTLSFRI